MSQLFSLPTFLHISSWPLSPPLTLPHLPFFYFSFSGSVPGFLLSLVSVKSYLSPFSQPLIAYCDFSHQISALSSRYVPPLNNHANVFPQFLSCCLSPILQQNLFLFLLTLWFHVFFLTIEHNLENRTHLEEHKC